MSCWKPNVEGINPQNSMEDPVKHPVDGIPTPLEPFLCIPVRPATGYHPEEDNHLLVDRNMSGRKKMAVVDQDGS